MLEFCAGSVYGAVLGVLSSSAEEGRAGCFALFVMWLSVFCVSSSRCHGLVLIM